MLDKIFKKNLFNLQLIYETSMKNPQVAEIKGEVKCTKGWETKLNKILAYQNIKAGVFKTNLGWEKRH